VSLGVGLGWWPLEYQVHGSSFRDRGARMEEALQILRLVWEQERTAFDGRFWSFPELTVHPRPVQRPRPPLWVAGVADVAIDRAARLGDAWLCGPVQPITKVSSMLDSYRTACARHGREPAWILRRFAWLVPTRDATADAALREYVHGLVEHWKESVEDDEDQAVYARFEAGEVTIDEIADERLLWGTPDDVIAQIERYRAATGAEDIHAAFGAGLPGSGPQASLGDFETIATMIRLFGTEVIPAFR
jgi:alkanesulfonate monooxygenase SsuD/methylene tetrahydromethanopterin reductase-like flavin-dependent oxidoreductase (luciferase family)